MTSILFALAVVALVVYGLERNHHRQFRLGSRLAGSADFEDRDLPRVQADLRATTSRNGRSRSGAHPAGSHNARPAASTAARSVPTRQVPVGVVPGRPVSLRQQDQQCLAR